MDTDASWEKRKATATQRMNLWRCTRRMLVHTDDPKYENASFGEVMQLDCETRPKYFEMEHVFWIRVSGTLLSTWRCPLLMSSFASSLTSWTSSPTSLT